MWLSIRRKQITQYEKGMKHFQSYAYQVGICTEIIGLVVISSGFVQESFVCLCP
jgi:hypothetical protein